MKRTITTISGAALLMLAACSSAHDSTPAAEANDIGAASTIEEDADARAERLDEQAAALNAEAARVGGKAGAALRREAADDQAEVGGVIDDGSRRAGALDQAAVNSAGAAPQP